PLFPAFGSPSPHSSHPQAPGLPPSTFLPSYYAEGRSMQALSQPDYHSPAAWEKLALAGPSSRHLLDGVPLPLRPTNNTPPPALPSYEIPSDYAMGVLPIPPQPWLPKSRSPWNEVPLFDEHLYPASPREMPSARSNSTSSAGTPGQSYKLLARSYSSTPLEGNGAQSQNDKSPSTNEYAQVSHPLRGLDQVD
ncbi:hypothetical protein P7C73_g1811, partial [Tremellales sp. Uapishka_1]